MQISIKEFNRPIYNPAVEDKGRGLWTINFSESETALLQRFFSDKNFSSNKSIYFDRDTGQYLIN